MEIPKDIQVIMDQLEQEVEVSVNDLKRLETWYTGSVRKLQDDIEITKIKKSFDI